MKNCRTLFLLSFVITCFYMSNATAEVSASSVPALDVAVLKAQLETTRHFQDSFMSMAQWTLGTAIAVAFALAAFSWFSNKATYERDRDAIRQEAKALQENLHAAMLQQVNQAKQQLEESLNSRQTALQQTVEKAIQPKLDKLQSSVKDAVDGVLELRTDLSIQEADDAVAKKKYTWAIYKYCQALENYVKLNTDFYEAADVLDKISNILKISDLSLDADTVSSSVATLQLLPKQHHPVTEALIARFKKALA